jgi:bifunctional non-homologous end joining protein LigD
MHRFPKGATERGAWQQAVPRSAPEWLPRGTAANGHTHLVADEPAALIWAANLGALEWRVPTSTIDAPEQPTHAVLDLRPGELLSWSKLLVVARLYRTALEHVGVRGSPMLTGDGGVAIWIPIRAGRHFDETQAWADQLSETVAAVVPELADWTWRSNERGVVAPYSLRAAAGAPVATPIGWSELDDPSLKADSCTLRTVLARVHEEGDLFAKTLHVDQQLPLLK